MNNTEITLEALHLLLRNYSEKIISKEETIYEGINILQEHVYRDIIEHLKTQPKAYSFELLEEFKYLYKACEIDVEPKEIEYSAIRLHDYEWSSGLPVSFVSKLNESLYKKLQSQDEELKIGAMVDGLILFGSNRHQAEHFVEEYLGCSYEKVKQKYVKWKIRKPSPNKNEFLMYDFNLVINLIAANNRKIPERYPLALKAYIEMYEHAEPILEIDYPSFKKWIR